MTTINSVLLFIVKHLFLHLHTCIEFIQSKTVYTAPYSILNTAVVYFSFKFEVLFVHIWDGWWLPCVSTVSPQEVDILLQHSEGGVDSALNYAKSIAKYMKDIISYVDKRITLGNDISFTCLEIFEMHVSVSLLNGSR